MANETVTITKEEYLRLLNRDLWLHCLEEAGVNNWTGFAIAADILDKDDDA